MVCNKRFSWMESWVYIIICMANQWTMNVYLLFAENGWANPNRDVILSTYCFRNHGNLAQCILCTLFLMYSVRFRPVCNCYVLNFVIFIELCWFYVFNLFVHLLSSCDITKLRITRSHVYWTSCFRRQLELYSVFEGQ